MLHIALHGKPAHPSICERRFSNLSIPFSFLQNHASHFWGILRRGAEQSFHGNYLLSLENDLDVLESKWLGVN